MVWYYRKINRHDTGLTFKAGKKLRIEIDGVDAGVCYYKLIRKVEMIKRAVLYARVSGGVRKYTTSGVDDQLDDWHIMISQ